VPKELGWTDKVYPSLSCRKYKCQVALHEPPNLYFDWLLRCYTLQQAGFTIKNDWLSMEEWHDLGTLKSFLEAKREHDSLSNVSQEMLLVLSEATKRRR
jgi:hypothetical protein